ncbi:Os03g0152500, partial [Oryza sativa Japonica Group]
MQLRVRDDGQAEDVEHGEEAEEHVGPLPALVLVGGHHPRRGDEVAVRQDDALAIPRRARRVEESRRVALLDWWAAVIRLLHAGDEVGVERDGGVRRQGGGRGVRVVVEEDDGEAEPRNLGHQGGDGDDELGARVGDLLGDLPRGVVRVDGGADGAEGGDGEEADRVEHAVGREEEHGVAGSHARAGGERDGGGEDGRPQLREGEGAAAGGRVGERDRGGAGVGAAEEEVGEGEAR